MSSKKKILFIHETLRQGGTSRQLLYLYNNLDRVLFDPIFVLYRTDRIFYKEILHKDNVFVLRCNKESYVHCIKNFITILKKENPDCIQSFNPRMNRFIYMVSLFYPIPPLFVSIRNTNLNIKKRLFEFVFQHRSQKLLVNSAGIKKELIYKAWIAGEKIRIIHNALSTNDYYRYPDEQIKKLRSRHNIDDNTFLVLSIGRIHKQKNILCTIKAIAGLRHRTERKIRFLHIGLGQSKKTYKKIVSFISNSGLKECCDFMGPVHDIVDFYNMADVVVLSSLWEGLPNVVIEAMACENVVVVAESADNDRIVEPGVTGYRFKTSDDHDLAYILEQVMGLSTEERRRIGENARLEVMRRFSVEKMVADFQELYRAV